MVTMRAGHGAKRLALLPETTTGLAVAKLSQNQLECNPISKIRQDEHQAAASKERRQTG